MFLASPGPLGVPRDSRRYLIHKGTVPLWEYAESHLFISSELRNPHETARH
jgi:hypothetical protein